MQVMRRAEVCDRSHGPLARPTSDEVKYFTEASRVTPRDRLVNPFRSGRARSLAETSAAARNRGRGSVARGAIFAAGVRG